MTIVGDLTLKLLFSAPLVTPDSAATCVQPRPLLQHSKHTMKQDRSYNRVTCSGKKRLTINFQEGRQIINIEDRI